LLETGELKLKRKYTPEQIQAFRQEWSQKIGAKEWCQIDAYSEAHIQGDQPPSETSRYDDLLTNLSQEEAEHQRKKQAREQARKKLEEQEFARRQATLSAKDKKLQA